MDKKILYIDMDSVIVDFVSAFSQLSDEVKQMYAGNMDNIPGIFSLMKPMDGAIDALLALTQRYDCYLLSTAPWDNPSAWSDKLSWVKEFLPAYFTKKLILSHNKQLNIGDYLIDDRTANGAGDFKGELITFDPSKSIKSWDNIVEKLL